MTETLERESVDKWGGNYCIFSVNFVSIVFAEVPAFSLELRKEKLWALGPRYLAPANCFFWDAESFISYL